MLNYLSKSQNKYSLTPAEIANKNWTLPNFFPRSIAHGNRLRAEMFCRHDQRSKKITNLLYFLVPLKGIVSRDFGRLQIMSMDTVE